MKDIRYIKIVLIVMISISLSATQADMFQLNGQNAYASQTDIDAANNKKNTLEQEKEKTKALLESLNSLKSDAEAYVKQLDASLGEINAQIDTVNNQVESKQLEIQMTKAALDEATDRSEQQYEAMKLRIKYMYEKGDTSYLDMLLEASDAAELLNKAEYVSDITSYDRRKLDEYAATCNDITSRQKMLEDEEIELEDMQLELTAKQDSIELLLADKKKEMDDYNRKIGDAQTNLTEYEKQIKQQEDAIKSIEEQIRKREEEARKAAEAAGKNYATVNLGDIHFIWPCPSSSKITSGFGDRESPTEGASSNHQGIDIGAATGSAIVAAASGDVVVSTYSPSAGNYIMLSHGGGVFTVYMHCSSLLVSAGDHVEAGATIAKVGSTGYSTGSHLHFGIRSGGKYLNPRNYVSP